MSIVVSAVHADGKLSRGRVGWAIECAVFMALLHQEDARRASEVADAVAAHDLRCALAGGLAIAATQMLPKVTPSSS